MLPIGDVSVHNPFGRILCPFQGDNIPHAPPITMDGVMAGLTQENKVLHTAIPLILIDMMHRAYHVPHFALAILE